MQKIVINTRHGGFDLSEQAVEWLIDQGIQVISPNDPKPDEPHVVDLGENHRVSAFTRRYSDWWLEEHRDSSLLVQCVEALGEAASGRLAALKVVEVPDDVSWEIEEYDGLEWVAKKHRTWA